MTRIALLIMGIFCRGAVSGAAMICTAVLLFGACFKPSDSASRCVPGRVEECPCPSGQKGSQTCQGNGIFETCQCLAPPPSERAGEPRAGVSSISCPASQELLALVQSKVGVEDVDVSDCVPGRFPAAGWYVHVWDEGGMHRLVIDAATRTSIGGEYISLPPRAAFEKGCSTNYVGDFDDDGVDEILEIHESGGQGVGETYLVALKLFSSGKTFHEVMSIQIGYDDGGSRDEEAQASSCETKIAVLPPGQGRPRALMLEGTIHRGLQASVDSTSECISGRRTLELKGGRFVPRP